MVYLYSRFLHDESHVHVPMHFVVTMVCAGFYIARRGVSDQASPFCSRCLHIRQRCRISLAKDTLWWVMQDDVTTGHFAASSMLETLWSSSIISLGWLVFL